MLGFASGCGDEAESDFMDEPIASSAEAVSSYRGHYFPWPAGQTASVLQRDGTSHENQVDFNIPGTVCASKSGTVVFVKQSSTHTGCGDLSCWQKANLVVIQHDSGEYSWYYHLAPWSVPVQVGSYVSAGTKIGIEGTTGFSTTPHLHFMVSTGHNPWTNPSDPNVAPWATDIVSIDFGETPWTSVSGNQVSQNGTDVSVVSNSSGTIEVLVHGQDNVLYRQQLSNGAWQGSWTSMGGVLTSAPDADSWGSNHRAMALRGITNEVWYLRWNATNGWGSFTSLGTPDGSATSDPSVVAREQGTLDVFVRGGNQELWRKTWASGAWGAWTSLGGTLVGGIDAMSWGTGHSDVFALGTDGNIYHRYLNNGVWYDWTPMGQPPSGVGSDTAAVCKTTNACHLFVRGKDRQLYARDYNGVWGDWYSLQGVLTSGPDAVSWGSGHAEVWARGLSNNLFRRVWQSNTWGAWQDMGSTP
jgi:hypothetical protein